LIYIEGRSLIMKAIINILLIFILTIFCTACNNQKTEINPTDKKSISIGSHYCINATYPLIINDYTGKDQPVHPKVLYFDKAWHGWRYWMSYTPYPKGNSSLENPSIAVSNDGINWTTPLYMHNPVVNQPGDVKQGGHLSDPHLVLKDDTLQLWYRYNPANTKKHGENSLVNKIYMISTKNGVNWSKPKIVFNDKNAYLSPAIIYDNVIYKVWFSDFDGKLHYKQSSDLVSWTNTQIVNIKLVGYKIWHQDVIKDNDLYVIVFTAYKNYKNIQCLYYAISSDGINFTKPEQILKPSLNKTALDNQMIYRSSLVNINGKYKVYYSAMDKHRDWHIFLTYLNSR
jgi:predicted GH43/DUF377 family glycosyl hydrolase